MVFELAGVIRPSNSNDSSITSGWISPVIGLEWWYVLDTQHSPGVVSFDNIYPRRFVPVTIYNKLNDFKSTH
jgi:hypothetical protein